MRFYFIVLNQVNGSVSLYVWYLQNIIRFNMMRIRSRPRPPKRIQNMVHISSHEVNDPMLRIHPIIFLFHGEMTYN